MLIRSDVLEFGEAAQTALKPLFDTGSMAGFEFVRIINEPTATALAYSLDEMCSEKNIVVFDLGTNRVDVAVLNEDDELFEVNFSFCLHINVCTVCDNYPCHAIRLYCPK